MSKQITNELDINHVFVIPQNGGDTLYLPFTSISYVRDRATQVEVMTHVGSKVLITDSGVCDEFMAEYRGCVGLGD